MEIISLETIQEETIRTMLIITIILITLLIIGKIISKEKIETKEGIIYNIIIGLERTIGGIIAIILTINIISILYYFFL